MVGGPTDVVVETNIVRGAAAARDVSLLRPAAQSEPLPRAIPLPDSAGSGSWPLQPEPAAGGNASRLARSEPDDESAWPSQSQPEAAARGNRDTLSALHDELSSRPLPRSRPQTGQRPLPSEPRMSSAQPSVEEPGAAVDQSLAEMAHRLEAALRKPTAKPRSPVSEDSNPLDEAGTTPPLAQSAAPGRPRSQNAGKMLYDSLEQEMASLLGRPVAKL